MDKFARFVDLEDNYTEGKHFRVGLIDRGGTILILAPHGGRIERGTSEIATSIAGDNLSLYLFEGWLPTARESKMLHITSTHFDEPRCIGLIGKFRTALTIHGCDVEGQVIYVGGKDNELKRALITELGEKGYPVQRGEGDYAATRSANICNRTSSGMGVQLELSRGLRRRLFADWSTRKGRKTTTALFARLVSDIRDVIDKEILR